MTSHTTDYLIIGAGATGLAFADTLLQESDAHVTLVDLHAQPGGHWNDAYPFVALHQPSAFYGVNSLELGTLRKDTAGHNAGLYELASGAEVNGYFHKVMHQQLLPSGRVRYLPMTRHLAHEAGVSSVASILSGEQTHITVRKKIVDATYFSPQVPATTPPAFPVASGVHLVTPT
jgi:NAD(P)-binding Rossmann-like domain